MLANTEHLKLNSHDLAKKKGPIAPSLPRFSAIPEVTNMSTKTNQKMQMTFLINLPQILVDPEKMRLLPYRGEMLRPISNH